MITATFHCGGCDEKAQGHKPLSREFVGINGKGYGFGHYRYDNAGDVVPEGWIAYDLIGCCYCPKCWESIQLDAKEPQS